MSSKLEIMNSALEKCGLPRAATESDIDYNAAVNFEPAARQALRSFPWGFALGYTKSTGTGASQHGFAYKHAFPANCLRVIDIRAEASITAPKARFVVAGSEIYCNCETAHIRYVKDLAKAPNSWPEDFANAVAYSIAAAIASLSAQTASLTTGLMQMYQLSLAQAQAIDSTETCERVPLDESILATREGRA